MRKAVLFIFVLILLNLAFVNAETACNVGLQCGQCKGNTPSKMTVSFEGVNYCGTSLPAIINKKYTLYQITASENFNGCAYHYPLEGGNDNEGIEIYLDNKKEQSEIRVLIDGGSYSQPADFKSSSVLCSNEEVLTATQHSDNSGCNINGGTAKVTPETYTCTKENLIDNVKVKIGKDEIKLVDPNPGVGTSASFEGTKAKLIGSVSASLKYVYGPDGSNILIRFKGSFFSPETNYFFESKCHIKQGKYTAKEYDLSASPARYAENGKTIDFEILSDPCPGKCKVDSDCWEDPNKKEDCSVCNVQKGICEIKKTTEGCRICNGGRNEKILPIGDYCLLPESKNGVCKKGETEDNPICIELTCALLYGDNYKNCPLEMPSGKTRCSDDCCKSTDECCHTNKAANPVCCNTENFKCGIINTPIKQGNYCNILKCQKERPVFCDGTKPELKNNIDANWCCKTGESCSVQNVIGDKNMPICVKENKQECNKETEEECRQVDGGVLCCNKETEECIDIGETFSPLPAVNIPLPVKVCAPKCESPKFVCNSINENAGKMRICCNPGELCAHNPNGLPRCAPNPAKVEPTAGITGQIIAVDSGSSLSIGADKQGFYSLRSSNLLTENGESYRIYTKSGEELSEKASFEIDNPDGKSLYYYEEGSINDCIQQVIFSSKIRNANSIDWCNGADTNKDKIVDANDYLTVKRNFGKKCSSPDWCNGADTNQDGFVDVTDLKTLTSSMGKNNCFETSSGAYMDKVIVECDETYENQLANLVEGASVFEFPEDKTDAMKETVFYYKSNALSLENALKLIKEIIS